MSFTRARRGAVVLELGEQERALLRGLVTELVLLVQDDQARRDGDHGEGSAAHDGDGDEPDARPGDGRSEADALADLVGIGTATEAPADPALARLFPDAYADDPAAAGDFRRYTERSLRRRKVEHAETVLAGLDASFPFRLAEADHAAWLGALNDLRLVLGVRLDVREDDDPIELATGPDGSAHVVYWWLGELQGDLLDALG